MAAGKPQQDPSRPEVRKVRADDLRAVAQTLARAFDQDPPTTWVLPDAQARAARLPGAYHLYLDKLWFSQGECLTADDHSGAAVWLPPGGWEISPLRQLMLLPAMAFHMGPALRRLLKAIHSLESGHPRTPHFYLAFAGVVPERQGRGIGASLLRPVLHRCDRERLPAYLEASTPENRRLYERHGFEAFESFRFTDDAPTLWRMWREPRDPVADGSRVADQFGCTDSLVRDAGT